MNVFASIGALAVLGIAAAPMPSSPALPTVSLTEEFLDKIGSASPSPMRLTGRLYFSTGVHSHAPLKKVLMYPSDTVFEADQTAPAGDQCIELAVGDKLRAGLRGLKDQIVTVEGELIVKSNGASDIVASWFIRGQPYHAMCGRNADAYFFAVDRIEAKPAAQR